LLIAATAIVHRLPVVTGNLKHFQPVPDLHVVVFLAQPGPDA
jgi:predicted nucleic acid-binding protein